MPHQNLGPDRVLSDSGQHCVDLSPIKTCNFGWGPNFIESAIFFGSHVLRLATEDYMLFGWNSCARCLTRTFGLDRVLSDSGQHCVDLSPIKTCNFGWGPNFIESPSSLVQMFYDLQRKIMFFGWNSCARCLTRTLGSL